LPTNTGVYPIVSDTVTLASGSNQALSGFSINKNVATGANAGIIGNNNVNALIANNRVSITAPSSTPVGNSGRGVVLIGASGNTNVSDNQVNNAIAEGIRLDNVSGTAAITGNTVINTIQPDVQTQVEAGILVRNNTGNVNLTIANNTVGDNTPAGAFNEVDGIEFSLCRVYPDLPACSSTATAIVDISGNTIRNITSNAANADGIDINLSTNAIARFTISNNNLSNISDKGISFGADDASKGSAIISNNTFNGMGEVGVQVRVAQATGATADLSSPVTLGGVTTSGVVISGNQISNTGQSGIRLRTQTAGQLTVTVNNNSIVNANNGNPAAASDEGGILVRTQDNSIIRATLTNNIVSNTSNQANSGGLLFRKQNSSNLCVKVQNNQSSNAAVVDYRFNQTGGTGQIQLSGIGNPITTTGALQTALLAQGNTGVTFGITGTVSVPTATCTFP
jgi:hypothetical protein